MNPWDVTAKLFSKLTWSQSSNLTMSDKLELYFNDYDIIPLMVHVSNWELCIASLRLLCICINYATLSGKLPQTQSREGSTTSTRSQIKHGNETICGGLL